MEKKPEIINIQWCSDSMYRVSKPSWGGGKVVSLEDYNALQSQNERLLSALKSVMGMWRIANAAHYGRNSDAVSKFTILINEIEKQ